MTKQDWFWTIIATIASILAWYALLFTQKWLASIPLFSPPNHLPSNANPLIEQQGVPKMFLGLELKGNWILFSVAFLGQLLNVIAEEFWWRGYILPRQELVFQKRTWVIHGLLWTLFHIFWKWELIQLLPGCLILSYVVYKRKNILSGIIIHLINLGMGLIPIILVVSGIIS